MKLPDHPFVRSANPNFGSAFGGGCAERVHRADFGMITCGFPEIAHPAQPDDISIDQATAATRPQSASVPCWRCGFRDEDHRAGYGCEAYIIGGFS